MATFILVHGAWHDDWCWKKVSPLLRTAGHHVYPPPLTGLGECAHLLPRAVGLDTHVQDIVNVLDFEDLSGVILVGHSYAGGVITGVAERAASRLAHLVYPYAFVSRDGETLYDLQPPQMTEAMRVRAQEVGDGWKVPPLQAGSERPERSGMVGAAVGPTAREGGGEDNPAREPRGRAAAAHIYRMHGREAEWAVRGDGAAGSGRRGMAILRTRDET